MTAALAFLLGLAVAIPLACLIFYVDRWRREEKMLRMMRPRDNNNCEPAVATHSAAAQVSSSPEQRAGDTNAAQIEKDRAWN